MPLTCDNGKTQHRQHHDNAFANEKLESFLCVCCQAKDVLWKTCVLYPNSLCGAKTRLGESEQTITKFD